MTPSSRRRHRMAAAWMAAAALTAPALLQPSPALAAAPVLVRTIGGARQADTYPGGIDVAANGDVVIADTGNDRIERYAAGTNTVLWSVGMRGGTLAQGNFQDPRDVAVDANYVYVADTGHSFMQIIDAVTGAFVRKWQYPFRSPIGVSVGTDGQGHERVLVSNGGSGTVDVFDGALTHLFTIPPKLSNNAGTRDAATDPNGNIYVADYRDDAIHKYDRTGTYLLSWGGTGADTCHQIPGPYGVDVDDQSRVYVAASDSNRVKSFTAAGACLSSYGTSGTGEFQVSQVRRVAVSEGPTPQIYSADLWGIKVLVYNVDGSVARRIGSWPKPSPGGFNEVHDVAVSATYVYAPDTCNHRAERFDLDGGNPIAWGTKGVSRNLANYNWPQGMAVNPATGNVWVVDTRNSRLMEFGPAGSGPLRTIGKLGTAPGSFKWPEGMTFDAAGNAYVADSANNRIQSFSPTWSLRWTYGSGGVGLSNLRRPTRLTVDTVGNRLLVADTANGRIVSLNLSTGARNEILPIAKGTGPGQLLGPEGVAVDPATGDIWVSEAQNNRVERFSATGVFSGVAIGGGGPGSTAAKLNHPAGLRFGPGRLLYIADAYNNRIQVFSV